MVRCPIVLQDYNSNMNCVDKFDQNKKTYQIDRKSQKWWHRIFFFFFDATIVNARILYNDITNENMSMKEFRRHISRDLVAKTLFEKRRNSSDSPVTLKHLKKGSPTVPKIVSPSTAKVNEEKGRPGIVLPHFIIFEKYDLINFYP
ncbi:hypothetical protein QTP88_002246 [Uroleucon formosanum]